MKNTLLLTVAILIIYSCSNDNKVPDPQGLIQDNSIEGSWKLVYAHIDEKDSYKLKT